MSSSGSTVKPQRAALLAIGDEVLRGEIINRNAAFLSQRMFEAGLEVVEHLVISDDPRDIRAALVRLRAAVDVLVSCGGLGPTDDDRTVDVVAGLLGVEANADERSLDAMKKRFSTHGFELTPNNLRQVRVPAGGKALPNSAGVAPGVLVFVGGPDADFPPGVPHAPETLEPDPVAPPPGA